MDLVAPRQPAGDTGARDLGRPRHLVELYGQDHSPWVQAVLLGLHEKSIAYTLTTAPPPSAIFKSGVLMPAARFDGGRWGIESAELLQAIGFDAPSPEEIAAIRKVWLGVTWRTRRPRRFFAAASRIRDPHPSALRRLFRQSLRAFVIVYFFLLLWFVRAAGLQPDPDDFADQFLYWERRLADGRSAFLGGRQPNASDLLLFGMVQCHCSIPSPPVRVLQNDPRLSLTRAWIGAMHRHFARYPHCYSGAFFEPNLPAPRPAAPRERTAFWVGVGLTILLSPVTVPIMVLLALRVPRRHE
jgi:glutathione S-transferase